MVKDRHLIELNNIAARKIKDVGGKAAKLAEMIANEIPVPQAICLTNYAFQNFLKLNNIQKPLVNLLNYFQNSQSEFVKKKAEQLRKEIINGVFPEEDRAILLSSIEKYFKKNSSTVSFAIRSSVIDEDSYSASFAGMFSSFLNVRGYENLLLSIKKCWASILNNRVISYRYKKGFKKIQYGMGIVIQKMIDSEKSGIMFTSHPLTKNNDMVIIQASWGLGGAIVSGKITPDTYILDKKTKNILEFELGSKKKMEIVEDHPTNNTKIISVNDVKAKMKCLSEIEIKKLLRYALEIENIFGSPQDIEWTIKKGKVYILQSRPVTA